MLPDPAANPGDPLLAGADPATSEQRIRRLEDALANLQNTEWLAEHIAERVSDRLQANGAALPQAKVPATPESIPPTEESRSWFLFDLIRETRAMVNMFFDPRYRVSPFTWAVVLFTLPLVLLSGWWFPGAWIPIVGHFVDKAFDLVIALAAYKALAREARRYQASRAA